MNIFEKLKSDLTPEGYLEYKREELRARLEKRAADMRGVTEEAKERLLASADRCALGGVILPGTGGKPLYIGVPPRWLDKPTPDNEFHWQLNRLGNIATVSRAHLVTGEKRYFDTARDFLLDWI